MSYNASLYVPSLSYPSKDDYNKLTFYDKTKKVEFSLTAREARTQQLDSNFVKLDSVLDREGLHAARAAYSEEERKLRQLFIANLLEEVDLPDDELSRKLFDTCWEEHHSCGGMEEVWNRMDEYANIYQFAKNFFLGNPLR